MNWKAMFQRYTVSPMFKIVLQQLGGKLRKYSWMTGYNLGGRRVSPRHFLPNKFVLRYSKTGRKNV